MNRERTANSQSWLHLIITFFPLLTSVSFQFWVSFHFRPSAPLFFFIICYIIRNPHNLILLIYSICSLFFLSFSCSILTFVFGFLFFPSLWISYICSFWDKKSNPEPWNKLDPTYQYKVTIPLTHSHFPAHIMSPRKHIYTQCFYGSKKKSNIYHNLFFFLESNKC